MSTRFAATIDNCDIAAKRAQCDYAGNNIEQTYAKKTDIKNGELLVRYGDGQYSSLFEANTDATCYLDLNYRTYSVNEQTHTTTFFPGFPTLADMQAIYTQPDWNASSGVGAILNKPSIPTVNDGTLTIKQGTTTLGTFTANQSGNTTVTISDTAGLSRVFDGITSEEVSRYGVNPSSSMYYRYDYQYPQGLDASKDYIMHLYLRVSQPDGETYSVNNQDLAMDFSMETSGSMGLTSTTFLFSNRWGSSAKYRGSVSLMQHIPSTYRTNNAFLEFLIYNPANTLSASNKIQLDGTILFEEAP